MINAFHKVKALGWVKSHRIHNTGIGKTFEDYMGVVENNVNQSDLFGFEIKSHRENSSSYVTLFTKSPSFPVRGANAYLKDKFGECYPGSEMKKLHVSVFAKNKSLYRGRYAFRLIHKPTEKKIYIGVFSAKGNLLDCTVYYTYEDLKKILTTKLRDLFYVTAKRKLHEDGTESFYFDSAEIYTEPSFQGFIDMMDKGYIMYDIRMGAYESGPKKGKPHDHGSGFRILERHLTKLYRYKKKVD